jgi:predicted O-methyltransferase YrrM
VVRISSALQLLIQDPALFGDYASWYLGERSSPATLAIAERPIARKDGVLSVQQALARIGGAAGLWAEGPALAAIDWRPDSAGAESDTPTRDAIRMAGDKSLGELVYALVRTVRPAAVVETGVATGVTSAHILAGLSDNNSGVLHSVDLPPLGMVDARLVGIAVPESLRARWRYHRGSSRRLLPRLLTNLAGAVGLFVHDSDHRYDNMKWELEEAWRALGPGGWLVADDVDLHSAFDDVADSVGIEPLFVEQIEKPGYTGMLSKPR